jgi:hypothetical protein
MGKTVEECDKLKLQNAVLRVQLLHTQAGTIRAQFEVLQRDNQRVAEEMDKAKTILGELKKDLSVKYEVDFEKNIVDDAGNIKPIPTQMQAAMSAAIPAGPNGG